MPEAGTLFEKIWRAHAIVGAGARLTEQLDHMGLHPGDPRDGMLVDLSAQTLRWPDGSSHHFEIDGFTKRCLVDGLDDIGLTLDHREAIARFQAGDATTRRWAIPA